MYPTADDVPGRVVDAFRRLEKHEPLHVSAAEEVDSTVLRLRTALLPGPGADPAIVHDLLLGLLHTGRLLVGEHVWSGPGQRQPLQPVT